VFVALTDDSIEMIDIREKEQPEEKGQKGDGRLFFKNGHVGLVKSMAVAHDETVLFTGGMDGSMLIWDVRKR
jgi:WD40 repeat protein